jgi:GNAT superfamily N-acetyltransferase
VIFEPLWDSAQRGELLLVDGGMCHFHLRRDGQVTIREIIVLPQKQGQGVGRKMLEQLKSIEGAASVFAKCPTDLKANGWYAAMRFELERVEETASGRKLNHWRLWIRKRLL